MALRFGNDALNKVYFGKKRIGKIYVGGLLVYAIEMYQSIILDRLYHTPVDGADVKKSGLLKISKIEGNGEIVNQLVGVNDSSITLISGHKYLTFINGTWALATGSGQSQAVTGGTDMIVDLTQQFGTGNEPTTLSDNRVKRIIAKGYVNKNNGVYEGTEIQRFEDKGFNVWDEQWEVGSINENTGALISGNYLRSKNFISVNPGSTYYIKISGGTIWLYTYDKNYNFVGYYSHMPQNNGYQNETFTFKNNEAYFKFVCGGVYGTTYKHNICINLSCSRNGQYAPARWQDFYEEVEYLESSGTQYIDTGIKGNLESKVDIQLALSDVNQNQNSILGSRTSGNVNAFFLGIDNDYFYAHFDSITRTTIQNPPVDLLKHHFVLSKDGFYFDNNLDATFAGASSFTTPYTLVLFNALEPQGSSYFSSFKLYSCKFYSNNQLVRDFIPCYRKSDKKPGLYDRANNVFYMNNGTGEFTLGPNKRLPEEYREVEYLESTGTQWIDTNVAGDNASLAFDVVYEWTRIPSTGEYAYVYGNRISEETNCTRLLQYGPNITYLNSNTLTGNGTSQYTGTRQLGIIYHDRQSSSSYTTNSDTISKSNDLQGDPNTTTVKAFQPRTTGETPPLKMYSLKISDNNVLVRSFVPCYRITDRKPGLYDKVNNKFYINSGTGEFVIGPDVELPAGYQELEYIESSGTQYVDSGILPTVTDHTKVIGSFALTDTSKGYNQSLGKNGNLNMWASANTLYFRMCGVNTNISLDMNKHSYVLELTDSGRNMMFDNASFTAAAPSVTDGVNFAIGALNGNDGIQDTYWGKYKIYQVCIYANNALVRSFIPARRLADNEVGLYDKINNKFYFNQGSGAFIAGPDVNVRTAVMLPQPIKLDGAMNAHDTFEILEDTYRFTRNVWKVDLSTLSYTLSASVSNAFYATNQIPNYKLGTTLDALCDDYLFIGVTDQGTRGLADYGNCCAVYFTPRGSKTANEFYVKDLACPDVASLNTKLQQTHPTFVYQLATPQVINIPKKHLGYVDLSSLNWIYTSSKQEFSVHLVGKANGYLNLICSKYKTIQPLVDKSICGSGSTDFIYIKDTAYTDAATLKASLKNVMLFYETQNEVSDPLLSLPFQKGGELNGQQYELPVEYQKVEYIESTGEQYIDTGLKSSEGKWTQDADVQFTAISSFNQLNGANFGVFWGINLNKNFDQTNTISTTPVVVADTQRHHVISSIDTSSVTNSLIIDGNIYTSNRTMAYQYDKKIYIACIGNANDDNTAIYYCNEKIYNYKILKNDVLLRNFIPCYHKSDNVIGLYDTVTNHFYVNQGTGTFLKGPDVSQIIDCEVLPNVTIDVQKS